ncbi:MAG: hypothetical protein CMJ74_01560 [Planctomycetaceae bacterium]|nr:hypothetical protein [Planctomycetaceae bacterium]
MHGGVIDATGRVAAMVPTVATGPTAATVRMAATAVLVTKWSITIHAVAQAGAMAATVHMAVPAA